MINNACFLIPENGELGVYTPDGKKMKINNIEAFSGVDHIPCVKVELVVNITTKEEMQRHLSTSYYLENGTQIG